MKKNLIILFILMIMGLLYAADPVVENVRLEQRTDGSLKADIYYDVTDADGDTLTVTVKASDDDGVTWELPVSHVSGDIGGNVVPGTNKHIIWNFLADNPDVSGEGYRIRVAASDYKEPRMVFIKGGTFDMGSIDGDDDESPVHTVTLSDFYIDPYEVTKAQYAEFLNAMLAQGLVSVSENTVKQDTTTLLDLSDKDCKISYENSAFAVTDNKEGHPVTNVTWFGADAYAKYYAKRLPTEAEWEYAARGGSQSQGYIYSGSNEMDDVGWYRANSNNSVQAVGQKQANEAGIYDMSGNVWEWCVDKYDRNYYGASPDNNPQGPLNDVTAHVLRGGAWNDAQVKAKPANRNRDQAWIGYNNRGFRCVIGDTNFTIVESIFITPHNTTVANGSSFYFTCMAQYSDDSEKDVTVNANWSIVSGDAVEINNDGLFTASQQASGNVTVQAEYNGITAEATVTVSNIYGNMVDNDGNTYKTIKIGDQWWMAENLNVKHYRNGDPIANEMDLNVWANLLTGAYCYYNNNSNNGQVYGALYNWFAVTDGRKIAPEGWHVPTSAEWSELENYLGGRGVAGGKLKSEGASFWSSPNTGATNESGFTALPGGYCAKLEAAFMKLGSYAYFWTSSEYNSFKGLRRNLNYESTASDMLESHKQNGFSLRLVKDRDVGTLPLVYFPNGGETLEAWDKLIIRWENSSNDDRVYVDLYKGNALVERLKDTGTSNDGDFTWIVSTDLVTGSDYRIKITGKETGLSDFSDGFFTIVNNGLNFETGSLTDIDGNSYRTVKIGDQWWMADNLNVKHYRNGDPIPNVIGDDAWITTTEGAYCFYNDNSNYAGMFGALYNWYAVSDERKIAPEGWHVPTDEEWNTLINYLGGENVAGGKMKEEGNGYWKSPNTGASNESGFSALAGGARYAAGFFGDMTRYAYYWSSTEVSSPIHYAWVRILNYDNSIVSHTSTAKSSSIRCIKD